MFKEMRRRDRAMTGEETRALLEKGEYGVLATTNGDGWPYAVPLSYVLAGDSLYFHCALKGQKVEDLRRDARVCFSVVGQVQAVYDGDFTTLYESATVYGSASEVTAYEEKAKALEALCQKYLPAHMDKAGGSIAQSMPATGVWKIEITHMTGKHKVQK